MTDITFSGLASGLDSRAIIDQLLSLERIPINQIQVQRSEAQSKIDLIGSLSGLVDDLKEKADALATTSSFYEFSATASFDGVADISASSTALAGSHTLEVTQLAVNDRWAADSVADADADLATATGQSLSFTVNGTDYSIDISDTASSSLNDIAADVNSVAGDDVVASVVNTGTDASPTYQLVLASRNSGTDFAITNLSSTIDGLTFSGGNNVTPGQDAQAIIDGLTLTRSDNDFSDVIEGVTIDLLSETAGEITFTIEPDKDAIKQKVDDLIGSYNEVVDFLNQQSEFNEDQPVGGLFGDRILSTVRSTITNALFDVDIAAVTADTEGYSTLSVIGISQDSDGRLSLDENTFDEKLGANLELLADLFVDTDGFDNGGAADGTPEAFIDTTADSGLADALSRAIDLMNGDVTAGTDSEGNPISIEGAFDVRTESLNDSIQRFDDQIEAKELRLERLEESLVLRYARLEELLGQLNSQGAALNAALGLSA